MYVRSLLTVSYSYYNSFPLSISFFAVLISMLYVLYSALQSLLIFLHSVIMLSFGHLSYILPIHFLSPPIFLPWFWHLGFTAFTHRGDDTLRFLVLNE